MNMDRQNQ